MTDKARETIIAAMISHSNEDRSNAAIKDFNEVDGHTDHIHGLHADAILAAMPSILAGMVELDFTHDIDGSWHADGVKVTFTVYFEGAYGWLVILNGSDDEWADYPYDDYGFEKREDAIECCNKENRATILKALGMKGGE